MTENVCVIGGKWIRKVTLEMWGTWLSPSHVTIVEFTFAEFTFLSCWVQFKTKYPSHQTSVWSVWRNDPLALLNVYPHSPVVGHGTMVDLQRKK